jgi:hypothetical protein
MLIYIVNRIGWRSFETANIHCYERGGETSLKAKQTTLEQTDVHLSQYIAKHNENARGLSHELVCCLFSKKLYTAFHELSNKSSPFTEDQIKLPHYIICCSHSFETKT